ncbi:serine protease 55 isoform X2 [Orcinus orca]|uniref:serine protease 55 isoform X2 n=1 Tax=Orcinus orca TaxID=9733 RepID=UPI0021119171|nr:serine protease 55 isoform X2 [Orcinus orca]
MPRAMLLWSLLLHIPQARDAHLECGERPVFERGAQYSRIIGGMEAEVGEFPWQVSIQARNEHFCGGAIISEWWIVSAAHCFHSEISPTELRVVLGTNSLSSPSLEVKGVTSIILHKDFQKLNMDNDISLLLLDTPITFSELKEPICMPTEPGLSRWHKCWVAGWGQTQTGLKQPMETELLKVPMTIVDWEKCLKEFPRLTKNMLCAGFENETYDACQVPFPVLLMTMEQEAISPLRRKDRLNNYSSPEGKNMCFGTRKTWCQLWPQHHVTLR